MRILSITSMVPYPLVSGMRVRLYNLLRRIAEKHDLWLATFLSTPEDEAYVGHLREFCQGVITVPRPHRSPWQHVPGLIRFALAGRPLELKFIYSKDLAQRIYQVASRVNFEIVEIENTPMAFYLEELPPSNHRKSILVIDDIISQQYSRIAQVEKRLDLKARAWLYSVSMRYWEPRYAERFDHRITVSEANRQMMKHLNPRLQMDVIPNGVDTQFLPPLFGNRASRNILFIGKMDYLPNVDAAQYFCHEILPRIRGVITEAELWIVGDNPTSQVRELKGEGVHVTGRVPDVKPYYHRCALSVVPLRAGAGTRIKILESMSLGRPVVSTTIGAEGLDVVEGEHLLIADNPEDFAQKVISLFKDEALYQRLVANARQLVTRHYDWGAIAERLLGVFSELVKQAPNSSY